MSISGTVPPHITNLNDIGDVNVPAPVDGYFVYWDAAAGKWKCKEVTATVAHLNDIGDVNVPAPADQYFLYWDGVAGKWQCRALIGAIEFVIDGGGSAITTGIKGDLEIPFACTITAVTMLADQSGSIVVDIWKQAYTDYPPEDANSITASAPPTITNAVKSQDTTLTGWTTAISAGDILRFNVDSVTTCQRVTISLKVKKT